MAEVRAGGAISAMLAVLEWAAMGCSGDERRDPVGEGFASRTVAGSHELLTPLLVPELALRLGDLRFDD
jgi:hypothetical protein